ncbi:MAG: hypothetical protein F6K56_41235 [Moorea sp. SIO3G5]|nr:hypothetical protein [Moorena sp. SIO3G5]
MKNPVRETGKMPVLPRCPKQARCPFHNIPDSRFPTPDSRFPTPLLQNF